MKTTVEIPEEALAKAMAHTGAKTKKEAINVAIEEFNRIASQRELLKLKGSCPEMRPGDELLKRRSGHLS